MQMRLGVHWIYEPEKGVQEQFILKARNWIGSVASPGTVRRSYGDMEKNKLNPGQVVRLHSWFILHLDLTRS